MRKVGRERMEERKGVGKVGREMMEGEGWVRGKVGEENCTVLKIKKKLA